MAQLTSPQKADWDQSRQSLIIGLLTFLLVLTNCTTILRIIASRRRNPQLIIEDYFTIAACVLTNGIEAELLYCTSLGFGLHEYRVLNTVDDPAGTLAQIFQIVWSNSVLNGINFLTIKLAVLLLYRRLFWTGAQYLFRVAWWINLVYSISWCVGTTIFYILQCNPVSFYWDRASGALRSPDASKGECISNLFIIGLPVILNTLGDICVLILPLPILWRLHTTLQKRLRLVGLFTIGSLAALFGLIRYILAFTTVDTSDFSYTAVDFICFSSIEGTLAIVCANIPIIVTLFEKKARGGTITNGKINGQKGSLSASRYISGFANKTSMGMSLPHRSEQSCHDFGQDLEIGNLSLDELCLDDANQTQATVGPLDELGLGDKGNQTQATVGPGHTDASVWSDGIKESFDQPAGVFVTHQVSVSRAFQ